MKNQNKLTLPRQHFFAICKYLVSKFMKLEFSLRNLKFSNQSDPVHMLILKWVRMMICMKDAIFYFQVSLLEYGESASIILISTRSSRKNDYYHNLCAPFVTVNDFEA